MSSFHRVSRLFACCRRVYICSGVRVARFYALQVYNTSQQTQNFCITFVQRRPNVFDVGPTLYKCYTNGLCLLGYLVMLMYKFSWILAMSTVRIRIFTMGVVCPYSVAGLAQIHLIEYKYKYKFQL